MLWLALYFPQLPIDRQQFVDGQYADNCQTEKCYTQDSSIQDSFTQAHPTNVKPQHPSAVVLSNGARRHILACNASAAAAGVHTGMPLKSAYALMPNLHTSDYSESEQLAHLEQLTLWALKYSSSVVPAPPDTVLIEIQASLTLFGGLDSLLERIGKELHDQRVTVRPAIAPTPSAATLFTRAGIRKVICKQERFKAVLASISVIHLPFDNFTLKGLRQSGIHTLGELQSIPAAALSRRFGQYCTDLLYKLDGRLPDPRTPYTTAETFFQSIDLPLEAPDTQALEFALKRLLGALGGFLKARDLGIQHLNIHLHHHRQVPSCVVLQFLDATANMDHLLRVSTEKLHTLTLAAPVTRLAVESKNLAPIPHRSRDLLRKSQSQAQSIEQVLDKLVARLGKEAVYTAVPEDDHRPEKASACALLTKRQIHQSWPARPLWLMAEPKALSEPVNLQTLPERIENGWWDKIDVRRDYFIACNEQGTYYWLYRLRHQPDQWWIHGIFA